MKISVLISLLQEVQAQHGDDVIVMTYSDVGNLWEAETAEFQNYYGAPVVVIEP